MAASAAAGWGGDHYQFYYQPERNASALAVEWLWDSEKEAGEFFPVLFAQLDARYGASNRLDRPRWQWPSR